MNKRLHLAAQCALETLAASGARTEPRLNVLVKHFASSYALQHDESVMRILQAEALEAARRLPDFIEA